ncbi:hypothetical protein WJX74_008301 [Apatococcus lobatus]|uniref:cyclin-dependent kinase n=1 Tax=Apatococcus lobatus TaxID=904363 RepID=A0AAW1QAF1_9CHLO
MASVHTASPGSHGLPPPETDALPVLDDVQDYDKIQRIGEGTYGVVYKAKHKRTGELVALKKLRMEREKDGMPITSVRELRVLQSCRHENIVHLQRVVTGTQPESVFLVFEFCTYDIGRLLDTMTRPFSLPEVKCLFKQLLEGIAFLHSRWIVHRDLKLSNLLLTENGSLKLCDFGLARYFHAYEKALTPRVVTLWYRAPELLLGSELYTEAIDMWAAGCILAELLRMEPLFPAKTELETLQLIAKLLGSPTPRIWPDMTRIEGAAKVKWPDQPYNFMQKVFSKVPAEGVELLNCLLTYDPEKRMTARQALRHPFFTTSPLPRRPEHMPSFPSYFDIPDSRHKGAADGGPRKRSRQDACFGHAFDQAR